MSKRDEFDDPEGFLGRLITVKSGRGPSIFHNKSLMLSIAVFGIVVALSGVIWASYPSQNPLIGDGAVPVIRADVEPYKHVPEDRGGLSIPHRDSTVFAAMRGDSTGPKVENLLETSSDEKPIDRAQLFAGLKTNLATASAVTAQDGTDDIALPEQPTPTEPLISKNQKQPVQVARMGDYAQDRPLTEAERRAVAAERNKDMLAEPAAPLPTADGTDTKQPEQVTAPTDEPAENTVTTGKGLQEHPKADIASKPAKDNKPSKDAPLAIKTGVGGSYVQIASVPSENLVKSEFNTVSSKLPMIKGLPYRVQKVDLKTKGMFHRIQVGPMNMDDATKLCASIKARKPGGCLVVK